MRSAQVGRRDIRRQRADAHCLRFPNPQVPARRIRDARRHAGASARGATVVSLSSRRELRFKRRKEIEPIANVARCDGSQSGSQTEAIDQLQRREQRAEAVWIRENRADGATLDSIGEAAADGYARRMSARLRSSGRNERPTGRRSRIRGIRGTNRDGAPRRRRARCVLRRATSSDRFDRAASPSRIGLRCRSGKPRRRVRNERSRTAGRSRRRREPDSTRVTPDSAIRFLRRSIRD